MNKDTERTNTVRKRNILRGFMRFFILPVLLLLVLAPVTLYLFCAFRPELVARAVQQQLSESTRLPWRINGSLDPIFLPMPGIRAHDVLLLAASEEQSRLCDLDRPLIRAKEVHIQLDIESLFSLRPRIKLIRLESPEIHLTYDADNRPLWLPLSNNDDESANGSPFFLRKAHAADAVMNATAPVERAQLAPPEAPLLPAAPPQGEPAGTPTPTDSAQSFKRFADILLEMPNSSFPPIQINNGSFTSFNAAGQTLLSFEHIQAVIDPHLPTGNLLLTADFAVPEADLAIPFSLDAAIGKQGFPAKGSISGDVGMTPPGSRTIKGSFASKFTLMPDGKSLMLPDFHMVAEGDGLTARLQADLSKLSCDGPVQMHKLSLPRWFGFGRSLPPGLQQPLDSLIGEFDLFLDTSGAEAWNLRGAAGDLAISGYVGVKDFSAPVVVVDLDLDQANLDNIFPFLAKAGKYVRDPRKPDFDHPVLAPYPSDPAVPHNPDDPGVDVGYDVKVRVTRPRVHDVDAGPLEVLVFPARNDKEDVTRVAFHKVSVLDGLVTGILDITDTNITMRYDANNAELALLPENLDSKVRFAGRVNGHCIIDMPMNAAGDIEDYWPFIINATISNCDISGTRSGGRWKLFSGTAKASGKGSIYTVLSKGISFKGLWDVSARGIRTSWNPRGNDNVSGQFNGALVWPPIERKPMRSRRERLTVERIGLDRLTGALTLNGSLAAPLGDLVVPVKGKLDSNLNWQVENSKISLDNIRFEGFGSYAEGSLHIDCSGRDVLVKSVVSSKLNPRLLLQEWDILPPSSIMMPKVMTGSASISSDSANVRFEKLKLEADGAPITGEISWKATGAGQDAAAPAGKWNILLTAEHLNLDNYFEPPKSNQAQTVPSQTPWDLKGFKNATVDASLTLKKAKYRQFTFSNTKVTGALQRDRFSIHADIGNFYDGIATLLVQGTVVPSASQVSLRKGLLHMQKISLGKALYDYTKQQGYSGTAEVVVDIAGNLTCDADFPGKLSGIWSFSIKDGLYPAFLSKEESNLRNTFSLASASGAITRGILTSNNFKLSGPLVDMAGGGTLNLATSEMDIGVSVTFAKVPTVPMRFTGTTDKPQMSIKGASMVVETVQAAGVGVFTLIKNVIELPAHAIRGINSLVTKDKEKK